MKAIMKMKKNDPNLSYEMIEEPKIGEKEILVKVHAAGICGSDIHILHEEYSSFPPVVLGHEYSGIVERVGSRVDRFKKGDRVVSMTAVETCGTCRYCMQGLKMLCPDRKSIGSGVNGAFAEYLKVPASLAFHIPANISMDEAALTEPLACVVRGVLERSTVKPGDYVYVSGPGIIGQFAVQLSALSGAYVVVAGIREDAERLDLALEHGASEKIIVDDEDVLVRTQRITSSAGFDVAFECSGNGSSSKTCVQILKKTGIYSQLGLYGRPILFNMDLALTKELVITNSYASEWTSWEKALSLLSQGRLSLKPLVGEKFPFSRWREAFDKMIAKESYKILLEPNS